MAKQAVARAVDLDPIDRLEERSNCSSAWSRSCARSRHERPTTTPGSRRSSTARARVWPTPRRPAAELSALRDERDLIRVARRRHARTARSDLRTADSTMSSVVTVEIAGQRYPIRSALDERYVAELAAYVDQKMRAASDAAPASDMLGLAVLVALNIADEYFRARDQQSVLERRAQRARPAARAHRGRSARASRPSNRQFRQLP